MRRARVVAIAVVVALTGLIAGAPPGSAESAGSTTRVLKIPGDGGIEISAAVIEPTGWGPGPHPLLVLPASWSAPWVEYVGAGQKLAREGGYAVISYTSRGFWDSGGGIDVAGRKTTADVSRVIDWGITHARGDAERVGVAGISYGAGQSLLAAAADPRVKAVAALSGWADLVASLYPNHTPSLQAGYGLLAAGHLTGRMDPEFVPYEKEALKGNYEALVPLNPERSAATQLAAINARKPAVFLANAWNESMFPPSQLTDFFTKLTGPKRLMLAAGDHALNEAIGAIGLPNEVWDNATRWFDHYLRGVHNGIDADNPVHLKPAIDGGTWRSYPDWASATATTSTLYLGGSESLQGNPGAWNSSIKGGVATGADSGFILVNGYLQGLFNIPTGVSIGQVDRKAAAVWSGPAYPANTRISGAPRLHTTVTTSAPEATLFAYLYDVDARGSGRLVSTKPYTLRGATPGQPQGLEFDLEPTVWDVPAGHHLALVVDTVDGRYGSKSAPGSTVGFGSSTTDPSWLRIPQA
ncbi:CocE/NonD family hydrolase [Amycolatopsis anabasis]|uniref:CocE/NonD family hydrolase n=1 Tax=Amycolatopsis anabasis TaxID=1840409 RepID=UPI00131CF184|nr:CocE/NonD family hydrolase [Amycolatopsis anabasis]